MNILCPASIVVCTFLPLYCSCVRITNFSYSPIIWNPISILLINQNSDSIIKISHSYLTSHITGLFYSIIDSSLYHQKNAYPNLTNKWIMETWISLRYLSCATAMWWPSEFSNNRILWILLYPSNMLVSQLSVCRYLLPVSIITTCLNISHPVSMIHACLKFCSYIVYLKDSS